MFTCRIPNLAKQLLLGQPPTTWQSHKINKLSEIEISKSYTNILKSQKHMVTREHVLGTLGEGGVSEGRVTTTTCWFKGITMHFRLRVLRVQLPRYILTITHCQLILNKLRAFNWEYVSDGYRSNLTWTNIFAEWTKVIGPSCIHLLHLWTLS